MGMNGRKHSSETIEKMRASALERRYSEDGKRSHRAAKTGENNPMWRGGRIMNGKGYILIHKPDHPMSDGKGYVPEHRLVMSLHIGRYLDRTEHVHHINEDRQDNRIENLALMSCGRHTKTHHSGAKRSKETCARIGASKKGNKNRLGKTHSEETKRRIRDSKRMNR